MFLLSTTEQVVLVTFVLSAVLSIGMQSGRDEIKALFESKRLLAKTLITNFIVVPILGLLIVAFWPMGEDTARALLLVACAPGGAMAIQFTTKVPGKTTVAGAVFFLLALLSIPISPILIWLLSPSTASILVPWGGIVVAIVGFLLFPLGLGLLLSLKAPGIAHKLSKLFVLTGLLAFITFSVLTGSVRQEAMAQVGSDMAALVVFFAITMVLGWLIGGPEKHNRKVLVTATSMRNVALCVAIVGAASRDDEALIVLVAYSYLMLVPNMLYNVGGMIKDKIVSKREAKKQAKAES